MTTDGSPTCEFCNASLARRRKGTKFCNSTCRAGASKKAALDGLDPEAGQRFLSGLKRSRRGARGGWNPRAVA